MRIKELKPYFDKLKEGEVMMVMDKIYHNILTNFFREEDGTLRGYRNVLFPSVSVEENDIFLSAYNIKNLEIEIVPRTVWCMLMNFRNEKAFYKRASIDDYSTTEKFLILDLKRDQGKLVKFKHSEETKMLVALSSTDEDYYYVTMDEDGHFHMYTCVSRYEVVDEKFESKLDYFEIKKKLLEHFDNTKTVETIVYYGIYGEL